MKFVRQPTLSDKILELVVARRERVNETTRRFTGGCFAIVPVIGGSPFISFSRASLPIDRLAAR